MQSKFNCIVLLYWVWRDGERKPVIALTLGNNLYSNYFYVREFLPIPTMSEYNEHIIYFSLFQEMVSLCSLVFLCLFIRRIMTQKQEETFSLPRRPTFCNKRSWPKRPNFFYSIIELMKNKWCNGIILRRLIYDIYTMYIMLICSDISNVNFFKTPFFSALLLLIRSKTALNVSPTKNYIPFRLYLNVSLIIYYFSNHSLLLHTFCWIRVQWLCK